MQMAAAFGEAPDSSHAFSSTCTPQLEPFYSQAVWYGLYYLCYKGPIQQYLSPHVSHLAGSQSSYWSVWSP